MWQDTLPDTIKQTNKTIYDTEADFRQLFILSIFSNQKVNYKFKLPYNLPHSNIPRVLVQQQEINKRQ